MYDISITITLNNDNKLLASIIMDGQRIENPVGKFVNTYHADVSDFPQTGDNSNIMFWCIMMVISGTTCAILFFLDKKYSKTKR